MLKKAFSWNGILPSLMLYRFYRAMHFSAKRGIAIACRLSVCLSVCVSVCRVSVNTTSAHRRPVFVDCHCRRG